MKIMIMARSKMRRKIVDAVSVAEVIYSRIRREDDHEWLVQKGLEEGIQCWSMIFFRSVGRILRQGP
jgi:hypothetical protein